MYTDNNFQTEQALKEAIDKGRTVYVYQPGGMFDLHDLSLEGTVSIEGPHFPQPHKWYARAAIKDGAIVKLLKG